MHAPKLEQERESRCQEGLGTTAPFGQHQWQRRAWAACQSLVMCLVDCEWVSAVNVAEGEEMQQDNTARLKFVSWKCFVDSEV